MLGSDCPEALGACEGDSLVEAAVPHEAGEDLDSAGFPDAERSDAELSDAGVDDGLVAIRNPSFELQTNPAFNSVENQFGNDVFVSTIGSSVPAVGGLFANLDPWFACFLGTQAVSQTEDGVQGATDGDGFVATRNFGALIINPPGLYQRLTPELPVGRHSFEIDAVSSTDGANDVALRISASDSPCGAFRVSDTTPALRDEDGWRTYCLTITTAEALPFIGVVPIYSGSALPYIAFDNLRSVAGCP